jgi:hypothetical protein
MVSFSRRSSSDDPSGWFKDPWGEYEERWMDEDEQYTGYVQARSWDPAYGDDPDAEFWLRGPTGVIGLVRRQIVIVTHAGVHRGASRLTFPVDACFLVLHDDVDVRLRVRVELGMEESPTSARGEFTMFFRPEQADALRIFITGLQPGHEPTAARVVVDAEQEPAAGVVEPEPVEETPPVRTASDQPVLPRLIAVTTPEDADWICFRPLASAAQIISPAPEYSA